jgi:hypothetical protein
VRARLLDALSGVDRLVLLGDVLELRHGPVRDTLVAAQPALREIGAALGERGAVVIVPGNHDHHLTAPWFERRALMVEPAPLGLESAVDWHRGEILDGIARWLAPASVRAAYPGVWLREDVYATHGHYADRHTTVPMLERLGAGAMARIVSELPAGPGRAEDYEATLAPIYAWIHAIAQCGGPELGESSHGPSARAWRVLAGSDGRRTLRRRGFAAAFPALIAGLNRARLGPLHADLSGPELRRAGLRAFAEVVHRLEVRAAHVVFGHTHRAGPLPADDRVEWRAGTGAALTNTGCWIRDEAFIGAPPAESPYRPGFAVTLGEAGSPELVNVLDPRREADGVAGDAV